VRTFITNGHGDVAIAGTAFAGQCTGDDLMGNIECQAWHYGYSGLLIEV
jgi:hypothetical protein